MGAFRGCGSLCRYLDRRAERLVIEGYRRWTMGGEFGSLGNFERTADFFMDELGSVEGRRLFLAFVRWLDAVHAFRDMPAHSSPVECPNLCRDECMVLAMVAAAQTEDREGVYAATRRLVEPEGVAPAVAAAEGFAAELAGCGHLLLPVPAAVVRDIADRPARSAYH